MKVCDTFIFYLELVSRGLWDDHYNIWFNALVIFIQLSSHLVNLGWTLVFSSRVCHHPSQLCSRLYFINGWIIRKINKIKHQLRRLLSKGFFALNKRLKNFSDFISSRKNSNTASFVIRNENDSIVEVLGISGILRVIPFLFPATRQNFNETSYCIVISGDRGIYCETSPQWTSLYSGHFYIPVCSVLV